MARNFCSVCGAPLEPDSEICPNCGRVIEHEPGSEAEAGAAPAQQAEPQPEPQANPQQPYYAQQNPNGPYYNPQRGTPVYTQQSAAPVYAEQPEPVSLASYLGMTLTGMIPVAGLVFLLIWALDSPNRPNRRNFARAFLIARLILDTVAALLVLLFGMMIPFIFPFIFMG